jgi:hypothetical protein
LIAIKRFVPMRRVRPYRCGQIELRRHMGGGIGANLVECRKITGVLSDFQQNRQQETL